MSTAVQIDQPPPAYPKQEPIFLPQEEPIPPKEPYPKQDPPVAFQPVRMNLMPPAPAPVQFTSPIKRSDSTPMNYLPLSICTLVMCCFPLSLFAVRNSLKAKEAYNNGQDVLGRIHARKARNYALASIVCGFIVIGIALAGLGVEIANTIIN